MTQQNVVCVSGPTSDSTGGIGLRCGVVAEQWQMGSVCWSTFSNASGAEIPHFPFKSELRKKIPQDLKIYELYRSDGVSNAYQARLTVELFQLYESVWSLKGGVNGDRMHQPSLHRPNQQNNSCDPRAAHIHATLRSYTVNNAQMDIQMYIF